MFEGVAVVGAGPAGLTAAISLARAGVPVRVYESGPEPSPQSRASTFHPPTVELLDRLGLAEPLVAQGIKAATFQYRDRDEGLIAELDLSVLADDTRYPYRLQCEQWRFTRLVAQALEQMPHAEMFFDTPVQEVRDHADHAVLVLPDAEVSARWVIGADGAHSAVRKSAGIGFTGHTYPERYVVISTRAALETYIPDIAYVNYVSDAREWYALLCNPGGWRVLLPAPPGVPDAAAVEGEALKARLHAIAGADIPIDHVTLYQVHRRVADRFRAGRVVIVGDAAHINNPLGGMGMNSGIQDGFCVARRLADVLTGGDEAALDACLTWRRQVAHEYVGAVTDRNWAQLREPDAERRRQQQDRWRAIARDRAAMRAHLRRACMLDEVAGRSILAEIR